MKKLLILLTLFATSTVCADEVQLGNFYAEVFGGANFIEAFHEDGAHVEFSTGYLVGGGLGYRFCKFLRIEAEAAFRKNNIKSATIENFNPSTRGAKEKITLMGNLFFEIPLCNFIGYIGGGLGGRWDKHNFAFDPIQVGDQTIFFNDIHSETNGYAYQGIIGISYCVFSCVTLGGEYRYLNGDHIEGNHSADLNLKVFF